MNARHRSAATSRRTLMFVAGVAAAGLALAGCASDTGSSSESFVPADQVGVLKDSVPAEFADGLTVATQADIAPLTFTNDDGDVVGLDQDMLKALSEVLGVEIDIQPVTFENLILGLDSGTYDFVADTTIKAERLEKYDMLTYLSSSYSVATLADAPALPEDDTALCGQLTGIVNGEISKAYIENVVDPACAAAGLDPVALTEYKDFASTVLAVQSKNVDVMVVDTMTFGYFAEAGSGEDFAFNGPGQLDQSQAGYSFLKEQNGELADVVQQALEVLVDTGVYEELFAKYGIGESTAPEVGVLNPDTDL